MGIELEEGEFQALIGTVETEPVPRRRWDELGFKPS